MYERFGRAEKLMMRIRSLKWQAMTLPPSSLDDRARQDAATLVAELQALEEAGRHATTEDGLGIWEQRADALALRLSNLKPQ
jgi:hypothetical protein